MTNVTQYPCVTSFLASYTGTWVPTSPSGVGTLALVTGTGGGPLVGATTSTGDWVLVGLLVCWIVWIVIENHDGPWRSKKGSDDLD